MKRNAGHSRASRAIRACQAARFADDFPIMMARFTDLWEKCGGTDAAGVWHRLDELYGAPERHYHGWAHIADCLSVMDACCAASAALELAIWFHDAVYDTGRSDNEEQSALLFQEVSSGLSPGLWARVLSLIRVTARHAPAEAQPEEAMMCDIDLSILGRATEQYAAYVRSIRLEYSAVTDADWTAGRSRVLRAFLERPVIYRTPRFFGLEGPARANMRAELAELEHQSG